MSAVVAVAVVLLLVLMLILDFVQNVFFDPEEFGT